MFFGGPFCLLLVTFKLRTMKKAPVSELIAFKKVRSRSGRVEKVSSKLCEDRLAFFGAESSFFEAFALALADEGVACVVVPAFVAVSTIV